MPIPGKTILAAGLALALTAPVALAEEPSADTVVATVGDFDITLGHMIVMTSQLPREYQALPDDVLYDAVLDQLVRQVAIAKSVEGKLSKEARLALELQQLGFLAGEALESVASDAATDEAVANSYTENYAQAEPGEEYNASHILVETEDEAKALIAELEAGADFAELAKEKSTGPSGPSGGALGWFSKGMMVPPFEEAVLALDVGEVSGPVQTQFGWHVVKLNDKRQGSIPELAEVRDEIVETLRREAVTGAIEELVAAVPITKNETDIDPTQLRNMDLLKD